MANIFVRKIDKRRAFGGGIDTKGDEVKGSLPQGKANLMIEVISASRKIERSAEALRVTPVICVFLHKA